MKYEHPNYTSAVTTRYRRERMTPVPLLGVNVTPMSAPEVAGVVVTRHDQPTIVLAHNLHSVYLFHDDQMFRELYESADLVLVDGAPVRALTRPRNPHLRRSAYRIGSTDWIEALGETDGAKGLRIFVLGAETKSNSDAQDALRRLVPDAEVSGRDGFFDVTDEPELLETIRAFRPALVLVGMGMPRQEAFLQRNREALPPAVWAAVGGAIDYIGGNQHLAPRVLGRIGLEWLWRLAHSPSRLWRRYLLEPITLFALLTRVTRGQQAN